MCGSTQFIVSFIMNMWLQVLVFATIAAGSFASENQCLTSGTLLFCHNKMDMTQPPAGYWPDVTRLSMNKNTISELYHNSFTGFPNVNQLSILNSLLTEIDVDDLTPLSKLDTLYLQDNKIRHIVNPAEQTLDKLENVYLESNALSILEPNFMSFAPNLKFLSLIDNPIVVSPGQPIFIHPTLSRLLLQQLPALGALGSEMFSGLPQLEYVNFAHSGVTDITGAFVNNKLLSIVALFHNNITEVTEVSFAKENALTYLMFDNSPLEWLDVAVLEDSMAESGILSLTYTPFVCNCAHEDVYRWGQKTNFDVFDNCFPDPKCPFK